ncbi:hypothetical protein [Leifsonia sp. NPDC077715]|uniref:hypothetical protein n=1 Tax=Leifsonia sp. NPDC077715 TaxID=3155539 RepID=UPI0034396BD2
MDQSTVQRLVATFENGGRVDSLTGTEQPARVETAVSAGVKKSVQVYADGSVAVTSQQIESSQARSISGCTVVSGSGFRSYNRCKVAGDNGLVVLGYYASYTLVQGGFDYISSADGIVANCAITTCSNPTFPTGGTFPKREPSAATAIVIGRSSMWAAPVSSVSMSAGTRPRPRSSKGRHAMKRRNAFLGSAVGILLIATLGAAPAHASGVDWSQLQVYWTQHGVSAATQEALLAGIERGELPDSFTGATPVSESTIETPTSIEKVSTYADGSVSSAGVNAHRVPSQAAVAPRGIINCTVSSGSGYRTFSNCRVEGTNGNVSVWFTATYTLVQGAGDYISNKTAAAASSAPGTSTSIPYWNVVRLNEIAGTRAQVTATTTWNYGVGSSTYSTSLFVGADSASTSFG